MYKTWFVLPLNNTLYSAFIGGKFTNNFQGSFEDRLHGKHDHLG